MRFNDQKILEDCYKRQKEKRVSRGGRVVSLKPDVKRMKTDKLYRPPPTSSYNHVFSSRLFSAEREPLTQARMQKKFNLLEETVDIADFPIVPPNILGPSSFTTGTKAELGEILEKLVKLV